MPVGTPTVVNANSGSVVTTSGQTTRVLNLGSGIAANTLILIPVGLASSGTAQPTGLSDGAANVFTQFGAAVRSNSRISLWWFFYVAAPGATSVTISMASSDSSWASAWSVSGMQAAASDVTTNSNGLSTTVSPGTTAATTVADELIFGAECATSTTAPTYPPAGYTQLVKGTDAVRGSNYAVCYKIVAATGTQTWTHAATSETWAALISTFKGAAAATGTGIVARRPGGHHVLRTVTERWQKRGQLWLPNRDILVPA